MNAFYIKSYSLSLFYFIFEMQKPKLSKHWLVNYKEQAPILNDVEVPPSIGIISGWAKQKKCDFLWIPLNQNSILYENHFFCSRCKKFLSVGGSIENVKRHQLFHFKKETVVITENIPLSQIQKFVKPQHLL